VPHVVIEYCVLVK